MKVVICALSLSFLACMPQTPSLRYQGPQVIDPPRETEVEAEVEAEVETEVSNSNEPILEKGPSPQSVDNAKIRLQYAWRTGEKHSYFYRESGTISMSMAMEGMPMGGPVSGGMNVEIQSESNFDLLINEVDSYGWAYATLHIKNFYLIANGKRLNAISSLPREGRVVAAAISPSGEIHFARKMFMVVKEGQAYVMVSGEAKIQRASASASAKVSDGETEISVSGSVSIENGTISARIESREEKKVIQSAKSEEGMDILPKDIFRMLILPREEILLGQSVEIETPIGKLHFSAWRNKDNSYRIQTKMVGTNELMATTANNEAVIDPKRGLITKASGSFKMSMSMGGMNQTVKRKFTLTKQ